MPESFQNSRPCLALPMNFQNQGLKCQALTSSFQNSRTSQTSLMRFQSSRTCLVLPMGKHSKNFPGLDKLSKFQDLPGLSKGLSKSRVSRPNCQGAFQTLAVPNTLQDSTSSDLSLISWSSCQARTERRTVSLSCGELRDCERRDVRFWSSG